MAGRWLRSLRGSARADDWVPAAEQALSSAFLDLDRRQSIAENGVRACDELFPAQHMGARWEPVRSRCYEATTGYVALTERIEAGRDAGTLDAGIRPAVAPAVQRLSDAARAVDEFYHANRAQLERATATLATVPQLGAHARTAADTARRELAANQAYAGYPSVRRQADALDAAAAALDAATHPGAARAAAQRLESAAGALRAALAEAPGREQAARTTLASARTRLAAVTTRTAQLAPAYSTLLREFNAASSTDLHRNEHTARAGIDAATAELARADDALRAGDPEGAVERATAARAQLAAAERATDAVTDRLALLRAVRDDPREQERKIRFRLRDAQMLAVTKKITGEWALVLDAQNERIDRIVGTLTGRHPDYWAYVQGLDEVGAFIARAVEQMRSQAQPG